MNFIDNDIDVHPRLTIDNYLPEVGIEKVREEIFAGLHSNPKKISPKYFYDKTGSDLFEKITLLEEYYPTRTELSIISEVSAKLNINFKNSSIIELGSGDAGKISILFDQIPSEDMASITYIPVDISQTAIEKAAKALLKKYPQLSIQGIVLDFFCQLEAIPQRDNRIFCFFGSTIGNMTPPEAKAFLEVLGMIMHEGDRLLLGMDMVKDINVLEHAYNDKDKVTAAFNQNILNVVNALALTNFNPNKFEHIAFFNEEKNRIEMHLKAKEDMEIQSKFSNTIALHKGEMIHTENSHKFTPASILEMAKWAGLVIKDVLTDKNEYFSLALMTKKRWNIWDYSDFIL